MEKTYTYPFSVKDYSDDVCYFSDFRCSNCVPTNYLLKNHLKIEVTLIPNTV